MSGSAYHPNIARRMSKESDEPYLYESFTTIYDGKGGPDDKASYSKSDCMRMARQITDPNKLPVSCRDIVKNEALQRKAWEGASAKDRAQYAIATSKGQPGHHQLQRRLTSTTNTKR